METEISISQSLVPQQQKGRNNEGPQSGKNLNFHVMNAAKTRKWAFLIVLLFSSWLVLLMFGLSFDSSEYHDKILGKKMPEKNTVTFQIQPAVKILVPIKKQVPPPPLSQKIIDVLIYVLCTTPFNVAMLAAISALIGGLASNLCASNKYDHEWHTHIKPNSEEYRTYLYMTENPAVAMVRGFIVYLLVVTGAFLTNFTSAVDSTDKFIFAGATAPSYFKFAVTVTLLSYLVGYDPSRLRNLLSTINIPKKEENNKEDKMLEVLRRLEVRLSNEPSESHRSKSSDEIVHIGVSGMNEKPTKSRRKINGNANHNGLAKGKQT